MCRRSRRKSSKRPTHTLDEEEWRIAQSHSIEGARILLEQENPDPLAVIVAAQHHARHDLSGYPDLRGTSGLHPVAELVAIAAVYDALTSERAYRRAMPSYQAMEIIVGARGAHFDPDLVKAFVQTVGFFPPGTLLELDSGDMAEVLRPNPDDMERPWVRLIPQAAVSADDFRVVSLTERDADDTRYRRSVVNVVTGPNAPESATG